MSLTIDRIKQYKEIDMELSKLVHLYFDKIIKCNSRYCLEDWYNNNKAITTEREWLGKELPVQELLEIAYRDDKENNK